MKQGLFSHEQIIALLGQAERVEQCIAAICYERGVMETISSTLTMQSMTEKAGVPSQRL